MKLISKLTDKLADLTESILGIKYSSKADIEKEIVCKDAQKPCFSVKIKSDFDVKIVKWLAAFGIASMLIGMGAAIHELLGSCIKNKKV